MFCQCWWCHYSILFRYRNSNGELLHMLQYYAIYHLLLMFRTQGYYHLDYILQHFVSPMRAFLYETFPSRWIFTLTFLFVVVGYG